MSGDARRAEARALPLVEVAERLGARLKPVTSTERAGPCPACGGRDRFGINTAKNVWTCRFCATGGDAIDLVMHVQGCDFRAALDFLVGAADLTPDPELIARRRAEAAARERERQDYSDRMRARAIRDAREIWHAAEGADLAPARDYLRGRGIVFPAGWPPTLRCLPAHPYIRRRDGRDTEYHRGPCMIAAVQDPEGRVRAVHQTWIDPDRPGAKAAIRDAEGAPLPAKLVRGAKKGGAIRLTAAPPEGGVLVMGEGIETTASVLVARMLPGAAFWAGVDLGNMAGRQVKVPGQRHSGRPDMSDGEAFRPPAGLGRLVFLMDGDSDPAATRAKLEAGLRRAMRAAPGLQGDIVAAPAGRDFNDLIRPENLEDTTDADT